MINLKENRDNMRKIQMLARRNYMVLQDKFMLPLNIYRIIQDNYNIINLQINFRSIYVYQEIENFLDAKQLD